MKTLLDRENLVFNPPDLGCVLSLSGLPGGGSKIYDRSPYGNIGMMTGATWVRLLSGLWCLSFDGSDDKVVCADADQYDVQAFTALLWVNPNDVVEQQSLMGNYTYAAGKGGFAIRLSTNGLVFSIFFSASETVNTYSNSITAETWQLIACVYDLANMKSYVNAVAGTPTAETTVMEPSTNDLAFGVRPDNQTSYPYDGYIALPRVINRALSTLELQNIFDREKHLFGVW